MTRTPRLTYRTLIFLTAMFTASVAPARGDDAGAVAAVEGNAEVGRAGHWTPATVGMTVTIGDQLRTGSPGKMRVVFRDDSVLVLSDATTLVVDEQVFDPNASQSAFNLLGGKLKSIVSHYYGAAGANYEVRTPTAVAGVRGTEFVITYDPVTRGTEIVGVRGVVTVHSLVDPTGPGLLVTANQATGVAEGKLPTAPQQKDPLFMRQLLHDMEFFGSNQNTSVTGASAMIAGSSVPQPARAPASALGQGMGGPEGGSLGTDASSVLGNSPAAVLGGGTGSIGVNPGQR